MMENITSKLVKEIIKKQKISQKELCQKTGISESARSKYLNSDKSLRADVIAKLANALNVDFNYLLGQSKPNTYSTCRSVLLARGGEKLTDEEKKDLINLILSK